MEKLSLNWVSGKLNLQYCQLKIGKKIMKSSLVTNRAFLENDLGVYKDDEKFRTEKGTIQSA